MELESFQTVALALGLGLLVGLQREWATHHAAGIRTFAIITLLGAVGAMIAQAAGGWILGAGLVTIAAVLVAARQRNEHDDGGVTTQIAALAMYCVGAVLVLHSISVGLLLGGIIAVLLQWKAPLHGFVSRIGKSDVRALFQLALIALVILPVLPNRTYGPYDVLNPFKIWLMVVLIAGISVAGYLAQKGLSGRSGPAVAGILGGVISSTATTVSYARRARRQAATRTMAAIVIIIASTISLVRILVEVLVASPPVFRQIWAPLTVMLLLLSVGTVVQFRRASLASEDAEFESEENPANLRAAIVFALLYAMILLLVAAAKDRLGDQGLYLVATVSGLTDVDAITLSTVNMVGADRIAADVGWRMILLGAVSNIAFKTVAAGALGGWSLFRSLVPYLVLSVLSCGALALLWPGLS